MPIHLLIATIPRRRAMVEALLAAVAKQSLVPDVVHLVLDGYATDAPAPKHQGLNVVVEHRMPTTGGPGGRWRVAKPLAADVILINFDDDQCLTDSSVIAAMVKTVDGGGAAAYRGVYPSGWSGVASTGQPLVAMACGVMVCHAKDLDALDETRDEIQKKCNFDPFGALGDDDAAVSAHLWRKKVPMRATGPVAVYESPGARLGSQFEQRQEAKRRDGKHLFWQRREIAKALSWPWIDRG